MSPKPKPVKETPQERSKRLRAEKKTAKEAEAAERSRRLIAEDVRRAREARKRREEYRLKQAELGKEVVSNKYKEENIRIVQKEGKVAVRVPRDAPLRVKELAAKIEAVVPVLRPPVPPQRPLVPRPQPVPLPPTRRLIPLPLQRIHNVRPEGPPTRRPRILPPKPRAIPGTKEFKEAQDRINAIDAEYLALTKEFLEYEFGEAKTWWDNLSSGERRVYRRNTFKKFRVDPIIDEFSAKFPNYPGRLTSLDILNVDEARIWKNFVVWVEGLLDDDYSIRQVELLIQGRRKLLSPEQIGDLIYRLGYSDEALSPTIAPERRLLRRGEAPDPYPKLYSQLLNSTMELWTTYVFPNHLIRQIIRYIKTCNRKYSNKAMVEYIHGNDPEWRTLIPSYLKVFRDLLAFRSVTTTEYGATKHGDYEFKDDESEVKGFSEDDRESFVNLEYFDIKVYFIGDAPYLRETWAEFYHGLHTTDLNLTRYQIYSKKDIEAHKDDLQIHCLLYSISLLMRPEPPPPPKKPPLFASGAANEVFLSSERGDQDSKDLWEQHLIDYEAYAPLKQEWDQKIKNWGFDESYKNVLESLFSDYDMSKPFDTRHMKRVADTLKVTIVIHKLDANLKTAKTTYGSTGPILDIAMHSGHYFVFEVTPFTQKDFLNKRGTYAPLNSLKLLQALEDNQLIVDDELLYSYVGHTPKAPSNLLDSIEFDQTVFERKKPKTTTPFLAFADTETKTVKKTLSNGVELGKSHSPLLLGYQSQGWHQYKPKDFYPGEPDANVFLRMCWDIRDETLRAKKTKAVCYFHNLKFDINVALSSGLRIRDMLTTNGTVYGASLMVYKPGTDQKVHVQFLDSLKLINMSLSKFSAAFKLKSSKKEMIACEYYHQHMPGEMCTVDYYLSYMTKSWSLVKSFDMCKTRDRDALIEGIKESGVEFDGETFDPWAYYEHYHKFDCVTLKEGAEVFNQTLMDNLGVCLWDSMTISSLAHKYMIKEGSYDGVYAFSGHLRKYVDQIVNGGRVFVSKGYEKKKLGGPIAWRPHVERKLIGAELVKGRYVGGEIVTTDVSEQIVPGTTGCLDEKSLYAASAVALRDAGYGVPLGMAKKITDWPSVKAGTFKRTPESELVCFYSVEIKVTSIAEIEIPIFRNKIGDVLEYNCDLPKGHILVDRITLEEYEKYHNITYEFISGIYWDEGFSSKMADATENLYKMRCKAKAEGNTAIDSTVKLVIVSTYGKTVEKPHETASIVIDRHLRDSNGKIISRDGNVRKQAWNRSGVYRKITELNEDQALLDTSRVDTGSTMPHVGGMILSMSKRIVNEVFDCMRRLKIPMYYTDTDSIHLPSAMIPALEEEFKATYRKDLIGENLGQVGYDFNLTYIDEEGKTKKCTNVVATESIFYAKKVYCDKLRGERINPKGEVEFVEGFHFRMKGCSQEAIIDQCQKDFDGDMIKLYEHLCTNRIEIDNTINGKKFALDIKNWRYVNTKTSEIKSIGGI